MGKELMSMDELSVMDGSKCILQLRGVRPFLSLKYDITKHPNYKYLSDYDPKNAFDIAAFVACKLKSKANEEYETYEMDVTEADLRQQETEDQQLPEDEVSDDMLDPEDPLEDQPLDLSVLY